MAEVSISHPLHTQRFRAVRVAVTQKDHAKDKLAQLLL